MKDDSGIVVASALGVWFYSLSNPAQPIAIIAPNWVGQNAIVSMAMSPTENIIAVAYDTGRIELHSIATLQSIRIWETYQGIYKMDFSPDGELLAMATELGDVLIWDVATGQLATTLEGNVSALSVAYNKTGNLLVAGRVDKKVELWDPIKNNRLATRETQYSGWVADVAFSPLTDSLGVVSEDEGVTIYSSLATQETLEVLHIIASHSTAMAFSPLDENLIATAEEDGFLKVWELDMSTIRYRFTYEASVNAVAFAHQDVLVAGGDADGIIRIWNVVSGAEYVELQLP